jgi:hypothetical protein
VFWTLALLLILVSAFSGSISKDHDSYIAAYNTINAGKNVGEISFILLSKLVNHIFNNSFFLFLIYAILGVLLKLFGVNRLTEYSLFALLVFFSYYFFLHEMTQIRAGVASAFVLLCIPEIYAKNLKRFSLFSFLAIFFHYSAVVIMPLYFLKKENISLLYWFLIPIGYLLYYLNINTSSLIQLINLEMVSTKYATYSNIITEINVFNILMLARYCFSALLLWKWKLLYSKNIYAVLLIKVYIISSFVFIAFSDIPAVAFRVSELLAIVEIVLITYLIYIFSNKVIGKVLVGIISFLFICLILVYQKLILGYF